MKIEKAEELNIKDCNAYDIRISYKFPSNIGLWPRMGLMLRM